MRITFLSEGKLYLKTEGQDVSEIESPFARESGDRATARNQRNAWKQRDADTNSPYGSSLVWGNQAKGTPDGTPIFRQIARGAKPDELLYTLVMSASSGLFRLDLATREEVRLFHRQDFDPCGLGSNGTTGEIVVASLDKDELGKLELIEGDSRRRRQITSGDAHDSHPVFHPVRQGTIVFQSAGVGRDERGHIVALGASAICEIEPARGEVKPLCEDEHTDYLTPKVDSKGRLLFIRRPYVAGRPPSLAARLKALVLLPYHLLLAIYGFLDAFAVLFAKKSLKPAAGGPRLPEHKNRFATFQGLPVDLDRALKKRNRHNDDLQLVPANWELVRVETDGSEQVLAKHVVAFDISPADDIIYSDGLRIWLHGPQRKKLHGGHIIQEVAAV